MLVCYTSNGRQWMIEVLWLFLMEKLIDQVIRGMKDYRLAFCFSPFIFGEFVLWSFIARYFIKC